MNERATNQPMKSKRIKVAYVLTPITFGGAEKVSLNFLKAVDRNKFDITPILLIRPWEKVSLFAREILKMGYEYLTLPVSLKKGSGLFRVARTADRTYGLLKKGNYNIVHTHGYFADICTIPIARLLCIKTITTCHGFISNERKMNLYNWLDVCAIKASNRVIAVSESIKDYLLNAGLSPQKIIVIPNAVDTEFNFDEIAKWRVRIRKELQIKDHELVVGYLGRLNVEKGVNFLIEAAAQLIREGLPIRLLIVGDGDERGSLEGLARKKGTKDSVVFAGFQPDTQSWLSAFDLLSLPSLTEGTPMALLEAMAMGVPVVATNVGGVPKVVTNEHNGLLVEPGNVESMANAIRRTFDDRVLTCGLSAEAQKTIAAKYDVDPWCRNIENLYIK